MSFIIDYISDDDGDRDDLLSKDEDESGKSVPNSKSKSKSKFGGKKEDCWLLMKIINTCYVRLVSNLIVRLDYAQCAGWLSVKSNLQNQTNEDRNNEGEI